MNTMRPSVILASVLFFAGSLAARADVYDTYNLTFTGTVFDINAQAVVDLSTGNTVTSISGSIANDPINNPSGNFSYSITGLIPPPYPFSFNSPSSATAIPDNILTAVEPFVTYSGGLLFDATKLSGISGVVGGTYDFLLYSTPPSCGTGTCSYFLYSDSLDAADYINGDPGTLTVTDQGPITPVPEASTWLMLLLGFCGLGFVRARGRIGLGLQNVRRPLTLMTFGFLRCAVQGDAEA